jgi:hypothetical protein
VDAQVLQHLRRLGRKDPTTKVSLPPASAPRKYPYEIVNCYHKQQLDYFLQFNSMQLKALSTLSVLFAEQPADQVVQIVPQWAFEYKRLLLDYNRDVRRATNDAMSSLVTAVKYDHLLPFFGLPDMQLLCALLLLPFFTVTWLLVGPVIKGLMLCFHKLDTVF